MRVILIRHGQVPGNIERRYIGRTDQSLTPLGRQQASQAKPPAATRLFGSPYARCIQTARIVYPSLPVVVVDDLREMDFGVFEGRTAEEMADFAPYRQWVEGMCQGPVPGGESLAVFQERCCRAFEEALQQCDPADVAAFVVHGGTIMAIMGAFNDEGREYYEYHVDNCGFYVCEVERTPHLVLHRVGGEQPRGSLPPREGRR